MQSGRPLEQKYNIMATSGGSTVNLTRWTKKSSLAAGDLEWIWSKNGEPNRSEILAPKSCPGLQERLSCARRKGSSMRKGVTNVQCHFALRHCLTLRSSRSCILGRRCGSRRRWEWQEFYWVRFADESGFGGDATDDEWIGNRALIPAVREELYLEGQCVATQACLKKDSDHLFVEVMMIVGDFRSEEARGVTAHHSGGWRVFAGSTTLASQSRVP